MTEVPYAADAEQSLSYDELQVRFGFHSTPSASAKDQKWLTGLSPHHY